MSSRSSQPPERASRGGAKASRKQVLYILVVLFVFLYIFVKLGLDLHASLFFQHPDRLNFVIYNQTPVFYSLGINEAGNYAIPFYPDLKTQVPGGYSFYRIGALGKLVQLEKKPDLFRKTFSSITTTFVDYYFYEPKDDVFYGGLDSTKNVTKPNWQQVVHMQSNASMLDKLYILLSLNKLDGGGVYDINYLPYKRLKDDTIFQNGNFMAKYIGSFYQKSLRDENLNVQIIYTKRDNYNTALLISNMLNGNGIIVGDISYKAQKNTTCVVVEPVKKAHTETGKEIARYFNCKLETGETEVYDILFQLGDLQDSWEVE